MLIAPLSFLKQAIDFSSQSASRGAHYFILLFTPR